jgi:hypothetical protein
MRRALTLICIGAVALVLGTAPAGAATTYNLAGIEVRASPATFVGALLGQSGTWTAIIQHEPLNTTPSGTTLITGGAFSITTFSPSAVVTGTIGTGLITAGAVRISSPWSCSQRFGIGGSLNGGGMFAGTLTHYGFPSASACVAVAASFVGSATL